MVGYRSLKVLPEQNACQPPYLANAVKRNRSVFITGLTDIFECPLWPLHKPLLLQSTSSSYHCWSVPSSLWSWVHGFSLLVVSPRLLAKSPAAWPFPVHSHPETHTTCDITFRSVLSMDFFCFVQQRMRAIVTGLMALLSSVWMNN